MALIQSESQANLIGLKDLSINKEMLGPDEIENLVFDFYQLPTGAENSTSHREVSRELGRSLDARFIDEVLIPELNGEVAAAEGSGLKTPRKVHLIVPLALRAAATLVDPERNLLKEVEGKYPDRFRVTYLPVGATRHRQPGNQIEYYQYFPQSDSTGTAAEKLRDMAGLDFQERVILRPIDFGSASGVSMAELTAEVQAVLGVQPENTYIDTVIASDLAQKSYAGIATPRRLLEAGINENFWVVALGRPGHRLTSLESRGLGPKDWGQVCLGMEGYSKSSPEEVARFETEMDAFFGILESVVRLNQSPSVSQMLYQGNSIEVMREWYRYRLLED